MTADERFWSSKEEALCANALIDAAPHTVSGVRMIGLAVLLVGELYHGYPRIGAHLSERGSVGRYITSASARAGQLMQQYGHFRGPGPKVRAAGW